MTLPAPHTNPHTDALAGFIGLRGADLEALLGAMRRSAIDDLEIEHGHLRLVLRREHTAQTEPTTLVQQPPAASAAGEPAEAAEAADALVTVAAPSVGRFTPAVRSGADVEVDQILGTLQTLAVGVPIKAPCRGRVRDVSEAEIAEFGQVLVTIERGPEGQ
jgi:biotin carboxyl carrier protein